VFDGVVSGHLDPMATVALIKDAVAMQEVGS
jgi:hypothetical protein